MTDLMCSSIRHEAVTSESSAVGDQGRKTAFFPMASKSGVRVFVWSSWFRDHSFDLIFEVWIQRSRNWIGTTSLKYLQPLFPASYNICWNSFRSSHLQELANLSIDSTFLRLFQQLFISRKNPGINPSLSNRGHSIYPHWSDHFQSRVFNFDCQWFYLNQVYSISFAIRPDFGKFLSIQVAFSQSFDNLW